MAAGLASLAFDPAFNEKAEADRQAYESRPMVATKGETNMTEHLMKGGFIERGEKPMKDDDFHLLLQEEAERIDKNEYKSVEQLEDEQADDDTIEHYRRKRRLELLADREKQQGFGGMKEIMAEMFENEVTNFKGPAVMLLYRTDHEESELMTRLLTQLAKKFPHVKFRRLLGNIAVENFPPQNCPTVMVYEGGEVIQQFVTLHAFGGPKTNADVVEWCLAQLNILHTDLEEDPRFSATRFNVRRNYVDRGSNRQAGRDDLDDSDSDW